MLGQLDTFIAFAVVILGLSLLITVLNHIATALMAMRGTNLRWGIQTLLEHVDPRLAAHAREISEEVLRHPLISDSTMSKVAGWPIVGGLLLRWKLASAIRVEELLNIMQKLAVAPPATAEGEPVPEPGNWHHLLWMTLRDDKRNAEARLVAASKTLQATGIPHEQLAALAPQVVAQVQKAVGDIEIWFDSVMDRVSQRFAARMRVWTVIWSIMVAFVLHVDASQLLRQISQNPELRARLVASTDAMTRQAETVLNDALPDVSEKALTRLSKETGLPAPPVAAGRLTHTAALRWIEQQAPKEDAAALRARYDELVREEFSDVVDTLGGRADEIRSTLAGTGLRLIPDFSMHVRRDGWPDWWLYTEPDSSRTPPIASSWNDHFFGVLFSALLLSLGAPFWFNVLKTAATLRPVIASREKEERSRRA